MTPANPDALAFLQNRRSRPAKTIGMPVPSAEQVAALLTVASRTPDHGKLEPWRFVVIAQDQMAPIADVVTVCGRAAGYDAEQITKGRGQFEQGVLAVAVIEVQKPSEKIPPLEQTYTAGAVCLALLNAALASGWGANWLSGWPAHNRQFMREAFACADHERIAGIIHIGTARAVPPERPRPDVKGMTTWLSL